MNKLAGMDVWLGLALVAASILGVFVVVPVGIDMPADIEVRALAPNFWPTIVVIVIGIVGAIVALEGWIRNAANERGEESDDPLSQQIQRFAIIIAILAGIYWATPYAGMVLACAAGIMALCLFGGERRITMILGLGIGLPVVLYVFFVYVANVPLPVGVFYELL